ncbi:acyl-CoA thioesterase [Glutamicibacter ardleyensis]|uniref:acyl-CoA thioesterase n=2 Tax=Glutamicibacter ardleyensis TaxID=225894 RepID=UPI003F9BBD24
MNKREELDATEVMVSKMTGEFISSGVVGEVLQRTIEWVDTDAAGHHHNSVIMRFVEAAEAKLFRSAGIDSYFGMSPRVRQEIDFSAKLYFGQEVTVAVRIERVGGSSMTIGFKVWGHPHRGRALSVAATGRFVTVCVPYGEESSAPWPREILDVVAGGSK